MSVCKDVTQPVNGLAIRMVLLLQQALAGDLHKLFIMQPCMMMEHHAAAHILSILKAPFCNVNHCIRVSIADG